ncbi:hypothetical protein Bca4012_058460 [Brassica carinata]|uniref:Uncharacterized protein n=1 Tax=Brassica carinata TaxID=52824 RepID=A0A8X7W4P2_BRACI|nr:hypothetical protein Bca52824_016212 [Brassica carinata]
MKCLTNRVTQTESFSEKGLTFISGEESALHLTDVQDNIEVMSAPFTKRKECLSGAPDISSTTKKVCPKQVLFGDDEEDEDGSKTLDIDSVMKTMNLLLWSMLRTCTHCTKKFSLLLRSVLQNGNKPQMYMQTRPEINKIILGSLEWYLTVPTQNMFLGMSIKVVVPDLETEYMAHFFVELETVHSIPISLF